MKTYDIKFFNKATHSWQHVQWRAASIDNIRARVIRENLVGTAGVRIGKNGIILGHIMYDSDFIWYPNPMTGYYKVYKNGRIARIEYTPDEGWKVKRR